VLLPHTAQPYAPAADIELSALAIPPHPASRNYPDFQPEVHIESRPLPVRPVVDMQLDGIVGRNLKFRSFYKTIRRLFHTLQIYKKAWHNSNAYLLPTMVFLCDNDW